MLASSVDATRPDGSACYFTKNYRATLVLTSTRTLCSFWWPVGWADDLESNGPRGVREDTTQIFPAAAAAYRCEVTHGSLEARESLAIDTTHRAL